MLVRLSYKAWVAQRRGQSARELLAGRHSHQQLGSSQGCDHCNAVQEQASLQQRSTGPCWQVRSPTDERCEVERRCAGRPTTISPTGSSLLRFSASFTTNSQA